MRVLGNGAKVLVMGGEMQGYLVSISLSNIQEWNTDHYILPSIVLKSIGRAVWSRLETCISSSCRNEEVPVSAVNLWPSLYVYASNVWFLSYPNPNPYAVLNYRNGAFQNLMEN